MTAETPPPVCVAVCLECGLRLGHLDLTAGNVAIDTHMRDHHRYAPTFFGMPVLAIPDHLADNVVMQVPVGRDRRTVPLPVGVLRRPTARLRPVMARRYARDTLDRMAAASRWN